ncbi:MAG TPA: HAF repeat-containing protein, partial [Phycisphaerales bacterium]|nr:HAF repeat-containing protein [Phycisphaerales bacterium]
TEFDTLGGESAFGKAINDHSQIVGESKNKEGERRAFLYENGKTIDLNYLIAPGQWTLIAAADINNKGQITGYGTNAKGDIHAFLLTPVTK